MYINGFRQQSAILANKERQSDIMCPLTEIPYYKVTVSLQNIQPTKEHESDQVSRSKYQFTERTKCRWTCQKIPQGQNQRNADC